ncbi:hypothetical protein BDE02_17G035200 [Populus trichocarpa]|nr:hypothetical protein BDE02_17G035200 [Populus trichocarpa]
MVEHQRYNSCHLRKAGGGERNGIEAIVVGRGILGIEGMLGSGGKLALGTPVGSVGMLGSGGKLTFGTAGIVGIVGKVGCGRDGIEGNGGNAGLGRFGNCRRLRAASPPKNDKEMKRDKIRHLKAAMLVMFQGLTRLYIIIYKQKED